MSSILLPIEVHQGRERYFEGPHVSLSACQQRGTSTNEKRFETQRIEERREKADNVHRVLGRRKRPVPPRCVGQKHQQAFDFFYLVQNRREIHRSAIGEQPGNCGNSYGKLGLIYPRFE